MVVSHPNHVDDRNPVRSSANVAHTLLAAEPRLHHFTPKLLNREKCWLEAGHVVKIPSLRM